MTGTVNLLGGRSLVAWGLGMGLVAVQAEASPGQASDGQALVSGCMVDPPRLLEAPALGASAPPLDMCVRLRGELAGRAMVQVPAVGISRRLDLQRANLELGWLGPGPVSARVILDSVQTGGGTGYIGVAGEARVPQVLVAEARVDWHRTGLALAAGVVDDLWAIPSRRGWGMVSVAPVMSRRAGLQDRSDVGLWLGWTAPRRVASLTVSMTNGEGEARRERNNGKDVAGLLAVRPLAWHGTAPLDLEIAVYGKEGSRGAENARNHRVGGRVTVIHRWVSGGLEGLMGWGFDGDPTQRPAGLSVFVRSGVDVPVRAWARFDASWLDRSTRGSETLAWTLGLGPTLPWILPARVRPVVLSVGYEGFARGAAAAPLPGAAASQGGHGVFLQLDVIVDAGLRVGGLSRAN